MNVRLLRDTRPSPSDEKVNKLPESKRILGPVQGEREGLSGAVKGMILDETEPVVSVWVRRGEGTDWTVDSLRRNIGQEGRV